MSKENITVQYTSKGLDELNSKMDLLIKSLERIKELQDEINKINLQIEVKPSDGV